MVDAGSDAVRETEPRPFFDVLLGQRACRQFSDEPVGDDLVERCLRSATHAPSAENSQPWVFVVARRPEVRAGIADLTRRVWQDAARKSSLDRLPEAMFDDVDKGAATGMGTAPVIIVACGDTALGLEATLPSSVYLATQNLLLSAGALGTRVGHDHPGHHLRRRAAPAARAARDGDPDGRGAARVAPPPLGPAPSAAARSACPP